MAAFTYMGNLYHIRAPRDPDRSLFGFVVVVGSDVYYGTQKKELHSLMVQGLQY